MSMTVRRSLCVGLILSAGIGLEWRLRAAADEPASDARAHAGRTRTAPGAERYLLLKDGRLLPGIITHDDTGYVLKKKLGVIRFPNKAVERSFDSVKEAYEYLLARLPEDDPGERLRLAKWCLGLHLTSEARQQLEKILEISPDHEQAIGMLTNIAHTEEARTARGDGETKVDEQVRQTAGEDVAEDRAGALDSAVLRGAERGMGISQLPVIYDLPQPLAIRRAEEFRDYVHPVLQAFCAKCHNAAYDGSFQLITAATPRERTADVVRANLDATLRLIDRENPARSELLSSTLRPHGYGGKQRPIFPGSNNRAYRILAAWVNGLRSSDPVKRESASPARTAADGGETFAAERNRDSIVPLDQIARGMQSGDPGQISAIDSPRASRPAGRAYRYVEGQGMVAEDSSKGDPREFPLPYMMGGPKPTMPGQPGASQATSRSRTDLARHPADEPPARAAAMPPPKNTSTSAPATDESQTATTSKKPTAADKKKKTAKIDPAILQKLLQKNATRSPSE